MRWMPGYGFLAENAQLARRCEEEGIIFIGPRVEHLEMFGDKVNARIQAEKAGIPMIPGTKGAVKSFAEVKAFAEEVGLPVMIKAAEACGMWTGWKTWKKLTTGPVQRLGWLLGTKISMWRNAS